MENASKNLAGLPVLSNEMEKQMEYNGKVYTQKEPFGKLTIGNKSFWVFNPIPVANHGWERDERCFLGVPTAESSRYVQNMRIEGTPQVIYPVPFHIFVSGTWSLELNPPSNPLWIETEECEEQFTLDRIFNINEILQVASLENSQN